MRELRVAAALAAILFFLVGCAGLPEIPYDRSSAQVKTVGIVTPHFPDGPAVVLASSVGQSFGLIGALIDAGMQANRESSFRRLLDEENFSARKTFLETLSAELAADGYTVAAVEVSHEKADFLDTYPVVADPAVDAFLDISTDGYGYVAAGIGSSTPYRPVISLKARLVNARDRSVLMQNTVVYNPIRRTAAAAGVITIPPDPSYEFNDFDTLMADPPKAVTGLRTAVRQSAQTIGKLLK
jgi:hypothetical protein